jgi:small ligand-binding sensory domain FIST
MPFAAALSEHPVAAVAAGEVVGEVGEGLGPQPDVAVLFATSAHVGALEDVAATVQTLLDPGAFIGAAACAVLGGSRGVEDRPGLALWAGRLPGRVIPVHLTAESSEDGWVIAGLETMAGISPGTLVLVADPFTFPVSGLLGSLATDRPEVTVIGGMASAARGPGGNRLIIGGRVASRGAVGLLLDPRSSPSTVVSQGCRPIGTPFTVTRSERHVIHELAGRPALERLLEIVEGLSPTERALANSGLQCGIVVDDRKLDFERGDFLIRAVLGADRSNGAIAVGDQVPVGATVQFQVRDAATAGEDLEELLAARQASGALVFTCNGRGAQMFGDEHHDAAIIHGRLGGAVAGMFCAGEVGPVAGSNAVHGFTASVALFRDLPS